MPKKDETPEADDPRRLLTMQDVADRLHKSKRWLQDWMRGRSYGVLAGRTRLFTEEDFAAIVNALRIHPRVLSAHRAGIGQPTAESDWAELQKLLATPQRRRPPKQRPAKG